MNAMAPAVVNDVLYGADRQVADFVAGLVGLKAGWEQYVALGVVKGDDLVGGVVFHGYRPAAKDVEITAGFTTPRWCSPATFTQIMRYPINQLGCERCTARTAAANAPARRFLERLGFQLEGRLRQGYDGVDDMLVYGVLKAEGRWRRVV